MKVRKGYRQITINGVLWQYRIGAQMVDAVCEDGSRKRTDLSTLLGASWADIERAVWKRYLKIKPNQIATWLQS